MPRIATVEEFYAHALAIEHEAAERYAELAVHFDDRGEVILAGLCHNLTAIERGHHDELLAACAGMALPAIEAGDYRWLGPSSEVSARELLFRVATPRQLMEIALEAERRACDFFVEIARSTDSSQVRELAAIMAAEEREHVEWVRDSLEYRSGAPILS